MFTPYKYTKIKNNKLKKFEIYETTIFPEIEVGENDIYIITKDGDRLDLLAYEYYNDPTMWRIIAHANKIGRGGLDVIVGIQLRIPMDISKFNSDLKRINESG